MWLGVAADTLGVLSIFIMFEGQLLQVACVGFLIVVAGLRLVFVRSRDPFAVLFFIWSLIFVEVPVAIFGTAPSTLQVDAGLAISLPRPSDESCAVSLIQLVACYLAVLFAIAVVRLDTKTRWLLEGRRVRGVAALAVLSFVISVGYDFVLPSQLSEMPRVARIVVELLKIIFFDTAVVVFLFMLLLQPVRPRGREASATAIVWLALAVVFVLLYSFTGSKGAIFTIGMAAVIFPLALGETIGRPWTLSPRIPLVLAALVVSVILFSHVNSLRQLRKGDLEAPVAETLSATLERPLELADTAELITQRISIPLYRYLAICDRFRSMQPGDNERTMYYFTYTSKSLFNLLLPGTPFEDCYAPSSSLLEPLLEGNRVYEFARQDRSEYLRFLNSQPSTIFGLMTLAMGWFAPIGVFLGTAVARWLFRAREPIVWFTSLFAFNAALSCYGLEAALQLAISAGLTFALFCLVGRLGVAARPATSPATFGSGSADA
jgi:hypothetical protein